VSPRPAVLIEWPDGDGVRQGALLRVLDADTLRPLVGVTSVIVRAHADRAVTAVLEYLADEDGRPVVGGIDEVAWREDQDGTPRPRTCRRTHDVAGIRIRAGQSAA
jgi:hypothetical protein